jgi:hypothetical protein
MQFHFAYTANTTSFGPCIQRKCPISFHASAKMHRISFQRFTAHFYRNRFIPPILLRHTGSFHIFGEGAHVHYAMALKVLKRHYFKIWSVEILGPNQPGEKYFLALHSIIKQIKISAYSENMQNELYIQISQETDLKLETNVGYGKKIGDQVDLWMKETRGKKSHASAPLKVPKHEIFDGLFFCIYQA